MRAERPVARRDRDGHLEQRREILPHIELGILAADEHRDLARALRRFGLGELFRAGQARRYPSSRRVQQPVRRRLAPALTGSAGFSRRSGLAGSVLELVLDLRRSLAVGASAFARSSGFASAPGFGRLIVGVPQRPSRLGLRRVRLCFRVRRIVGRLDLGCGRRCIATWYDGADRRQCASGIRGVGPFAQRRCVADRRSQIEARLRLRNARVRRLGRLCLRRRPCRSSPRERRSAARWR